MCARYTLYTLMLRIKDIFNIENVKVQFQSNYNVAPSTQVPVIVNDGEISLVSHEWGFVPGWAKNKWQRLINAKAESVDEKPTFAASFRKKRCLFVLDGFYEWKGKGSEKIPTYFQLKSKEPFTIAGISLTNNKEGVETNHAILITTTSNELVNQVHDRMPAILDIDKHDAWLDNSYQDHSYLKSLLAPYPIKKMEAISISKFVNSPGNNSPDCIKPV